MAERLCEWCSGDFVVPVHGNTLCPECAVALLDALRMRRAGEAARQIVATEGTASAVLAADDQFWDIGT